MLHWDFSSIWPVFRSSEAYNPGGKCQFRWLCRQSSLNSVWSTEDRGSWQSLSHATIAEQSWTRTPVETSKSANLLTRKHFPRFFIVPTTSPETRGALPQGRDSGRSRWWSAGRGQSRQPHDLGMLLKVAEDLLPIRVRDLGVHLCVLDILVAEMIRNVLNAAASLEKMHGDRVAKRMD
jgi:hypothetical protein